MGKRRSHSMASRLSLSFGLARRLASTLGGPIVRAADRGVKAGMRCLLFAFSYFVSKVRAHPRISGIVGLSFVILTFSLLPDKKDPEPEEFEFVPIDLVEQYVDDDASSQPSALTAPIFDPSLFPPDNTVDDDTSTRIASDVIAKSPPQKSVEQAGFEKNPLQPAPSEKSRAAWLTGEIEEFPQSGVAKPAFELEQYPFNRQ